MLNLLHHIFLVFCVLVLQGLTSGCKPVPPTQTELEDGGILPVSADSTYFFPNDIQIRVGRRGEVFEGVWDNVPVIFLAGLWVGAQQRGVPKGNMVWVGSLPTSNFTARWGQSDVGVFHFNHDRVSDPMYPWPVAYGAPTRGVGNRVLYGDTMTWSAIQSDFAQPVPVLAEPIEQLRVTHSVYGYRRSDLRNVLFVRYDLKNMGSVPLTNVHVGYYSDTDLVNPIDNAVGYDPERGMTYTYTPTPADNFALFYAAGYAFMEVPVAQPVHGATAHRVIWKEEHPLYSELTFFSPSHILAALQGRDNNGAFMIDPTTGGETRYAFSGDPVTQMGWVDEPRDVRSLISSGPFVLEQDREAVVTVAWVVEKDRSLEGALIRLKAKMDQVRLESRLWDY